MNFFKAHIVPLFGIIAIAAVIGLSMLACDNGTGGSDLAERWSKRVDPESTATLDYSVDSNGICTITVGGTAEPQDWNTGNYIWKARANYDYTAKADTHYTYTFEAWTTSGTRDLSVNYYEDNDAQVYLGSGRIQITSIPTTYTVTGQKIPKGGVRQLQFQCANQTGIFYVKVFAINEYKIGALTITNFSGSPDLTQNGWVTGYASGNPDLDFDDIKITGSSITLDVWESSAIPFLGNVTVAEGNLYLYDYDTRTYYNNKVPITFTNCNATVNFGSQMEQ